MNPEATELTPDADLSLRGPAGVVLPRLIELITAATPGETAQTGA